MSGKRAKALSVVLLAAALAVMSACSGGEKDKAAEEKTVNEQSADKQSAGNAAVQEQTNTTQIAEGQSEEVKTENRQEAEEAETEAAAEQTSPDAQSSAAAETGAAGAPPIVTENPTDETLTEGYSCMYIASAENADTIEWRVISPDGEVDVPYSEIGSYFPYLEYMGEKEEALSLYNIPSGFDGWGSYCRFTNSAGSTDSSHAVTHVKPMQNEEAEQEEQQAAETEQQPVQTTTQPIQAVAEE